MADIFFNFLGQVPFGFWFFFIVIFLGYLAWNLWASYVRENFISGIDFVLLEIIPPREVLRSPAAMELFFTNALYHFSDKDFVDKYWHGQVQLWFSLEIVSIDGQVHFYINTPSRIKNLIETQMYAQYPQAQVKVVDDYAFAIPEISEKSEYNLWGCEFKLMKPDAYPIKTYVDFGLDKDPKEEYKVDPISPVVELFGSLRKGEQMWLQIVITPSNKVYHSHGKKGDWVEAGHTLLEKLADPYTKHSQDNGGGRVSKEVRVPKWLEDVITGINNKTLKLGFDVGIRFCYVAKKELFDKSTRRSARLIFHQYANPYMNQFGRLNSTDISANFRIVSDKARFYKSSKMLEAYRERFFFYPSLSHRILSMHHPHTFVLNTEELATLWHFPGQILKVPTLERIESKEASPPTNLPT